MRKPCYPWSLRPVIDGSPTIGSLMALCDENYLSLLRMAPAIREMEGRFLSKTETAMDLYLEILEQTPYTTLIHLTYQFSDATGSKSDPDAILRLYHDACQAEVLDLKQRALPLTRSFQFPALDQKWKVNMFLSKWLSYCAALGHHFSLSDKADQPENLLLEEA